jgi:DNA ligase 1
MNLETLYKKSNSTCKIEQWTVRVDENEEGGYITTMFGEVGGKIQTTGDQVSQGKNQGKKNETTAFQQACAEAKAKWEKKLKTGYVKSLELAESGATDELIQGGYEPMLAQPFDKHGSKVVYPCLAQPKSDGLRMVAVKENGKVTLWTRTRKPITSLHHIIKAIEGLPVDNMTFDGEAYNHDLKDDFETIVSGVRTDEVSEHSHLIQYHIYDLIIEDLDFVQRSRTVKTIIPKPHEYLKIVETVACNSKEDVLVLLDRSLEQGYEGLMLRNIKGKYESRRSYNLQKVKVFEDKEFPIVGVKEGRGKLAGHAATFTCKTEGGHLFDAKLKGSTAMLKRYLNEPELWQGKQLTVQFQGLTRANSVPRFPVGKAVRDYE